MAMNEVIRDKRRLLGYTQEQIAQRLGVSVPAVSKWENGVTYPDVGLLSALARVLNIDVNTLLCFKMELSDVEIAHLVEEVSKIAISQGIETAFSVAEQNLHEYPTDVKLMYTLASTLQGSMMMISVSDSIKEKIDFKIRQMYEQVGNSGNNKYADGSNFILASKAINEGKYEYAQELIDRLPEYSVIDKKIMQANLWMETGKQKEAKKIYASRVISIVNQIQPPLVRLIEAVTKDGDEKEASELVECGQDLVKAFGLWEYNSYLFSFVKATAKENVTDIIMNLDNMFGVMLTPWDISSCPIYKYIGDEKHDINLGEKMLPNIIDELEKSQKYDFLRGNETFQQLISKYKAIISK